MSLHKSLTQEIRNVIDKRLASYSKSNGNGGPTGQVSADQVSYSNSTTQMDATNVQTAIDELFTNVDDGKIKLATAITDKGINAYPTESFASLSYKIMGICSPVSDIHSRLWGCLALTASGECYIWGQSCLGIGEANHGHYNSAKKILSGEQSSDTYLKDIAMISATHISIHFVDKEGALYACGGFGMVGVGHWDISTYYEPARAVSGEQSETETYFTNVRMMSGGYNHNLVLDNEGHLYAIGSNNRGQLGIGDSNDWNIVYKRVVSGEQSTTEDYLEGIVKTVGGRECSYALDDKGNVYAWGSTEYGKLGEGSTGFGMAYWPKKVHGGEQGGQYLEDIIDIMEASPNSQTCFAIDKYNNVWAWGRGGTGRLGNGTNSDSATPVRVLSGQQSSDTYFKDAIRIGVTNETASIIAADGRVYSTGSNFNGLIGISGTSSYTTPMLALSGSQSPTETYFENAIKVTGGDAIVFLLDRLGDIYALGYNHNGRLGIGLTNTTKYRAPMQVVSGEQSSETYFNTNL